MSDERKRPERNERGQFLMGEIGNPAGRPRGARGKLGEEFVAALYADWQVHGSAVIAKVREDRPHEYLKLIASLLPRHVALKGGAFDDVGDDELREIIAVVRAALADHVEGSDEAETAH